METGRHTISHPAYSDDGRSPTMQAAVLVACSPLGALCDSTLYVTDYEHLLQKLASSGTTSAP